MRSKLLSLCPWQYKFCERPFVHLIIRSFVWSLVHLFVRSSDCLFIRSYMRSFIWSFVNSFIRSFVRSFIHSFIWFFFYSFICSFVQLFIWFFVHSCVRLYVHFFVGASSASAMIISFASFSSVFHFFMFIPVSLPLILRFSSQMGTETEMTEIMLFWP